MEMLSKQQMCNMIILRVMQHSSGWGECPLDFNTSYLPNYIYTWDILITESHCQNKICVCLSSIHFNLISNHILPLTHNQYKTKTITCTILVMDMLYYLSTAISKSSSRMVYKQCRGNHFIFILDNKFSQVQM